MSDSLRDFGRELILFRGYVFMKSLIFSIKSPKAVLLKFSLGKDQLQKFSSVLQTDTS